MIFQNEVYLSTTDIFSQNFNIQNFKRILEILITIFILILHSSLFFQANHGKNIKSVLWTPNLAFPLNYDNQIIAYNVLVSHSINRTQSMMSRSTSSRHTERLTQLWKSEPKKKVKEEMKGGKREGGRGKKVNQTKTSIK